MVETGHFPSWPRIEMRRPCISSSETLSTVPADRSLLSSPRAGRAHEGRSYSGLRPHLPGLGRVDQMRGLRDPRPLSPDWRHGLWSGHPFAAVEIAWDREQDVIYVIKANRLREA